MNSNYKNYLRAWSISKLYKISVNPKIIDKNLPSDKRLVSRGFDHEEVSLELFCDIINVGFATSYQFKNAHRKTENFICTDFICLDMDGGREIEEVLNDKIVKKYGSIFHTTASHTPDHHRFRIIFILPRTLTDVEDVKNATRSLAMRLKGDMSVADGARMFYGSSGSDPIILGNSLNDYYLDDLIIDSRIIPQKLKHSSKTNNTTNKSKLLLDMDQVVKTDKEKFIKLKDITEKTSIYCPYHYDVKPSSFVAFNHARVMYHWCSACQVTRKESHNYYSFNFNDFEDAVINLKEKKSFEKRKGIEGLLNPLLINNATNVTIQQPTEDNPEGFLRIDKIRDGITFIKSPKGSGKTFFLQHYIQDYVTLYKSWQEFEEDSFDGEKPSYHKDRRVLLIGHRQSLIGETCKRIGLHCYLDDKSIPKDELQKNRERYGICLDSLTKLTDNYYQTIIIDEVEQVLAHFLSDTIASKRYKVYEVFSDLIRKAKRVIVLDADISWTSFNALTDIVRAGQTIREKDEPKLRKNLQIHINPQKPKNKLIKMYGYEGQLIEAIKEAVLNKKRIFITSNSKKRINALNEMLGKMEKEENIEIKRLAITSNNSKEAEPQALILNVKTEILKYQVVLASPSLGTGIDITFEKEAKLIDHVFGFYEVQVNNHFDIDQQLSRVRHPKEISVYVSPRVFNFETEFGVVREDIQNEYLTETSTSNYVVHPNDVRDDIEAFSKLCAGLVSVSRHSMNSLRYNFIKFKEDQGFIIEWEKDNDITSKKGLRSYRNAKDKILEKEIANLLSAEPLNLYDFQRIKDRLNILQLPITPELNLRYQRTNIELFYRKPVTKELIEEDNRGKFRRQIRRYINMTDIKNLSLHDKIMPIEKSHLINIKTIYDYQTAALLLNAILKTTPVFDGIKITNDEDFCVDDLADFVDISLKLAPYVQTQFGLNIRKDFKEKPTMHLGQLLKLIGLKLKKVRTRKEKDRRIYQYILDSDQLDSVQQIASRQIEPKPENEMAARYKAKWAYMNDKHNFEYSDEQLNWLCPGDENHGEWKRRKISQGHEQWAREFGIWE